MMMMNILKVVQESLCSGAPLGFSTPLWVCLLNLRNYKRLHLRLSEDPYYNTFPVLHRKTFIYSLDQINLLFPPKTAYSIYLDSGLQNLLKSPDHSRLSTGPLSLSGLVTVVEWF